MYDNQKQQHVHRLTPQPRGPLLDLSTAQPCCQLLVAFCSCKVSSTSDITSLNHINSRHCRLSELGLITGTKCACAMQDAHTLAVYHCSLAIMYHNCFRMMINLLQACCVCTDSISGRCTVLTIRAFLTELVVPLTSGWSPAALALSRPAITAPPSASSSSAAAAKRPLQFQS